MRKSAIIEFERTYGRITVILSLPCPERGFLGSVVTLCLSGARLLSWPVGAIFGLARFLRADYRNYRANQLYWHRAEDLSPIENWSRGLERWNRALSEFQTASGQIAYWMSRHGSAFYRVAAGQYLRSAIASEAEAEARRTRIKLLFHDEP